MVGNMSYKEALRKRLELMEPSRQDITRFITDHKPQLTDGVKCVTCLCHVTTSIAFYLYVSFIFGVYLVYMCSRELVKVLHQRGVAVYLVSGGFHSIIEPVAEKLGIPSVNIRANKLMFFYNGQCFCC